MEAGMVWSAVLSFFLGLLGWVLKNYVEELKRVTILLNRTREEIAKEYVTKGEVHADINRVMNRLEALDSKLDRLLEARANTGGRTT
jgi:predicted DNA-binding protein YlxM (UPF0122 family)